MVGLANETWNTTQSHSITGEQGKRREADSEGVGEETQSLTVGHLRPFTNYTWEVTAVSGFGAGPPSDRSRFETNQDGEWLAIKTACANDTCTKCYSVYVECTNVCNSCLQYHLLHYVVRIIM